MAHRTGCCENRGLFFPILLILVGSLLLAQKFGIIELHSVWRFWPLILIGAGVRMLFQRGEVQS